MPNTLTLHTDRVTAVYLDGNTLMAAVVSQTPDGAACLHALRLIETEDLVERVERIPHPIYVNTEQLVFPHQDILSQAMGVLLQGEEFCNPVVGVLPPDLVDLWIDDSPCAPRDQLKRVHAGIKAVLDGNPYGYPKLMAYDLVQEEHTTVANGNRVRLWSCRFDDVLSIADQMLRLDMPFVGVVTGQSALAEIARQMAMARDGLSVILIDIGKLRTSYVGFTAVGRKVIHSIPVGLARDDNRYFTSFVPTLHGLRTLSESSGGLLIPPDYTPSGHFDAYPATPQIEVTRFATNVSEYTSRLLANVRASNGSTQPAEVTVAGLAAGLPGLRAYMEARTATIIQPFGPQTIPLWQSEDPDLLSRARNHLPAIGGALAYLRRSTSRFGIVQRENRPKRFCISGAALPDLEPENVYVLEWGSRG